MKNIKNWISSNINNYEKKDKDHKKKNQNKYFCL